jgi:hypothetical protein
MSNESTSCDAHTFIANPVEAIGQGLRSSEGQSPDALDAKTVKHRIDACKMHVGVKRLCRKHASNGSRWGPGSQPAFCPCSTVMASVAKPCSAMAFGSFRAIFDVPGSLPRRTLVAICQVPSACRAS